ncbi:MAG: 2-hydroxyacyl-CoA dehydratase [Actinobacteria bacterium]|nr:2-hydroxyacyl-CoA dehydratase [Actinomycetota bacterium]
MVFDKIVFPFKKIQDENIKYAEKKIGWFCTYTPEEIITAAGFVPFRITGNKKAKKAEGYFPINFCPYIKSSMEDLLDCRENLAGVVFTNSCDGMRRFYDTCAAYIPTVPSFLLDVPRIRNRLSVSHFAANLEQIVFFLENIGSKKAEFSDFEQAIKIHGEKKELLARLYGIFKKQNKKIGAGNYFRILKSAMTAEPVSFSEALRGYLEEIEPAIQAVIKDESVKSSQANSPGIMIIGNFIDEERLWDIFDGLDCFIPVQDVCNSERYFKNVIVSSGTNTGRAKADKNKKSLMGEISTAYLYKPQCMRMANLGDKIAEIKDSVEKNNIKGLIFISQKFCDNTLLFYPYLRQELAATGIPSLFLEIEHMNFSAGQIKTRIQAFLEII